jgi:hypothetical protein
VLTRYRALCMERRDQSKVSYNVNDNNVDCRIPCIAWCTGDPESMETGIYVGRIVSSDMNNVDGAWSLCAVASLRLPRSAVGIRDNGNHSPDHSKT